MKPTLEELKSLTPGELRARWTNGGQFPFDRMLCGGCLTLHNHRTCHPEITQELRRMASYNDWMDAPRTGDLLHKHIEELYALRLFFDRLYPQPEPEVSTVLDAEEKASGAAALANRRGA